MFSTGPDAALSSKLAEFSDALKKKTSIPQRVAEFVHDLIIAGELKPGDRVVEWRLAKRLGIGHPTVREALLSLEHMGLVVRQANQGCVVTTLSRGQISQILELRAQLEPFAAELAATNAPDAQLSELAGITEDMSAAGEAGNIDGFYRADLRFHQTMWALSGNTFLAKALHQTMLPLLCFCMLKNIRDHGYVDMAVSAAAHREIVEAISTRDMQNVGRVMREKLEMFARQHLREPSGTN